MPSPPQRELASPAEAASPAVAEKDIIHVTIDRHSLMQLSKLSQNEILHEQQVNLVNGTPPVKDSIPSTSQAHGDKEEVGTDYVVNRFANGSQNKLSNISTSQYMSSAKYVTEPGVNEMVNQGSQAYGVDPATSSFN